MAGLENEPESSGPPPASWAPPTPAWAPPSTESAPVLADPPQHGEQQHGEPQHSEPRNRSSGAVLRWLIPIGLIVLLVVGAVVTVFLVNQSRDPAAAVEEYLGAIADGDADRANELVRPGEGDASLLTNDVLEGADERIRVESVRTADRGGAGASVEAEYSLGGSTHTAMFHVERGPKDFGVLDTWVLSDPLIAEATVMLDIPYGVDAAGGAAGTSLSFGAAAVDFPNRADAAEQTVRLYPAVYTLEADGLGDYLEADAVTLEVSTIDEPAFASVDVRLGGSFEQTVLGQAIEYADGCVTIEGNDVVTGNMDPSCPSITRSTKLDALEVTRYAEDFVSIDAGSFLTDDFRFSVQHVDPDVLPETRNASLHGQITWRDGAPRVTDVWFTQ